MICSEQRENATYISKLDWNRRVAARIRRFAPPIDEILMEVAVSRCGSQLIMSIEELLMTSPFLARLAGFHYFHDLHDSLVSTSSTTCTTHWRSESSQREIASSIRAEVEKSSATHPPKWVVEKLETGES